MPRQPRLDAPGTLHHVMGRGIAGAKGARFLGVTTSAIIRAAYSEELPELQKYL